MVMKFSPAGESPDGVRRPAPKPWETAPPRRGAGRDPRPRVAASIGRPTSRGTRPSNIFMADGYNNSRTS